MLKLKCSSGDDINKYSKLQLLVGGND